MRSFHLRGLSALLLGVIVYGLSGPRTASGQGTLIGEPCEGCEAVFEYGDRALAPVDTMPGFAAAENKLKVTGTIYQSDGRTPADGVILYIYHTNEEGVYEKLGDETGWGRRHGTMRGWIRTGEDGRYTFFTSVPGSYGGNPAHIHPLILEPDGRYYYINSFFFEGDPKLIGDEGEGRGGNGVVSLGHEDGMLVAERDIVLGLNVPGYGGSE